jgi:hypothetical protein
MESEDGLELNAFVRVMLKYLTQDDVNKEDLVASLCELFAQVRTPEPWTIRHLPCRKSTRCKTETMVSTSWMLNFISSAGGCKRGCDNPKP